MNIPLYTSIAKLRATKARRQYLQLQDAPATSALPALPPNVQGIIDPDGTLHKDYLATDLIVEIPLWNNPPTSDADDYATLQLQYSFTGADDSYSAIGPIVRYDGLLDPGIFPLRLSFPQSLIPRNGPLWIRYHLDYYLGSPISTPIKLICDSVPPWGDEPAPPLLPPSGIINQDYLDNNPSGLELTIPEYPDQATGDTYQAFYLTEWPDEDAHYDTPIAAGLVPDNLKITIPAATVSQLGDGRFYIVYYLLDKAKNRSRIRRPTIVDVVLTPEPADLLPPRVPQADDGVLSLADAQAGIHVEIDTYTNARHEDKIAIMWGSRALAVEHVNTRPFPLSIRVPSNILRDEYGTAPGEISTNVSYQVMRGEAPYGPAAAAFDVDFSVAGPENPNPDDWPNPVNANIFAPIITSFSNVENEITEPDRDQDATLKFTVFEGAQNGQVVDFYWDGTHVDHWIVDQPPGSEKTVTIPWRYIEAAGNNLALPVHYTVRANASAINEQESVPQFVEVSAIDMTPDDLEFLGLSSRQWLNCSSLKDPDNPAAEPAIRVKVPPCSHLRVTPGTPINLTWKVYDALVGGDLIDEVGYTHTDTLTLEQIESGFVWRIEPYDQRLQPIYDAASQALAQVSYVIGTLTPSNPTENRISMNDPTSGGSCDLTDL